MLFRSDNTLHFVHPLTFNYSGVYVCKVTNSLGQRSDQKVIYISGKLLSTHKMNYVDYFYNNSNNNSNNSNTSSGRTLMMESTAYSYKEAGSSFFTASGTDLRKNPMAVAVDPSVIPLGTLVNVEGYGVALALDTGGAIKGNIIDVHFDNVAQCLQWGRRQVKVTILD